MLEREAMRWLQLTYKVPSEPSQKRVWVWRRLQNRPDTAVASCVTVGAFDCDQLVGDNQSRVCSTIGQLRNIRMTGEIGLDNVYGKRIS